MKKYLLNSEKDFKKWVEEETKYNYILPWYLIKKNFDELPKEYPCVLIAYLRDGGSQASDYYIWDFIYLSDFNE